MKQFYFIMICLLVSSAIIAQEKTKLPKEEKERREKNIQAANPFAKFGYKARIATLSKGKYLEVHDLDSIVTIGSVRFHVDRKEIVGIIEPDRINGEYTRPVGDIASRWLSPDPLAEEFPSWSPYTFVFNNPVYFIDPDGMQAIENDSTYGVDNKGNINKIDDKVYYDKDGKEIDKLIRGNTANYNSKGELTNKSVDVSKGVLDNKQDLSMKDSKNNAVKGYSLDFGKNQSEAKNVFEFLADKVNVEFSLITISNPENASNQKSMILTSQIEDRDYFGADLANKYSKSGFLKEHTHSHPYYDGPGASNADQRFRSVIDQNIKNLKETTPNKKINEPKFNVYHGFKYNPY